MRAHRAFHASVDAFRCMVGPRLLPCNTIPAKADKIKPVL